MILIIDCGSNKTRFIEDMVNEYIDFTTTSLLDLKPEDITKYKGVIISGAPILITEVNTDPYKEQLKWIKETSIPILGICFGHQMIGLLFGAFGNRMRPVRDMQLIEVFEESDLFLRLPYEINMMEDHCESISIPQDFKLVASSDACINEAMEHESKRIFGVQFHPEVSGNHGSVLIENFINVCLR